MKIRSFLLRKLKLVRSSSSLSSSSSSSSSLSSHHIDQLRLILGGDNDCVITASHSSFEQYSTDWTRTYSGGCAVLFPKTSEDVSGVLEYCNSHDIKITPQSGNTGLVGGSVPIRADEVILSLKRMNKIIHVDKNAMTVTADAGVILENLQSTMSNDFNLTVPLDLGSKGSCMIGGNVATNAGGMRVLRYGSLQRNVLGIEVIMADGRIVDMTRSLPKDNLGFHLKNIFIGSEGALGIITKVVLQLYCRPTSTHLMLLRLPSFADAVALKGVLFKKLSDILSAFEFMDEHCINELRMTNKNLFSKLKVEKRVSDAICTGKNQGISGEIYVIVETSGFHEESDSMRLQDFVSSFMVSDESDRGSQIVSISDAIVAQDSQQFQDIWALRELVPTSLMQQSRSEGGKLFKYDVSLSIGDMNAYVFDIKQEISRNSVLNSLKYKSTTDTIDDTQYSIFNFGHIGDGNLHLNVLVRRLPNLRIDSNRVKCSSNSSTIAFAESERDLVVEMIHREINAIIFAETMKRNGSFSAEHGVGQQKLTYLLLSRSQVEVELMRSLKQLWDPKNILNNGKLIK